ncbi:MAG TPA: diaminopimelate epimerase [Gammaproteobacteria bacterium]|nr:diaminopimelate epimerase [Gammaproteobacteria bacterium]
MKLEFVKMNGLGNDFMVVEWPAGAALPDGALVRRWADRRRGVGFDQLLLLGAQAPETGQASYRIFNADGGEVEQCGNGVRCLARLLAPRFGNELTLVSPAGSVAARVLSTDAVSVNLGEPDFRPAALPFITPEQRDRYRLQVANQTVEFGAVSMGNPHVVIPVDSVERAAVGILGAELEKHPSFPQGVNVGFMQRESAERVQLRVFERGVGETLACGTGAAAAVAVGRLWGELAEEVAVSLPGGVLTVNWRGPGYALWQTGPATAVYEGQIEI